MPKPNHKPKQKGEHGIHQGGKPRSIGWRTDYDYLKQLSPAERLWLAEFSDRFYGGDFRGDTDGEWSDKERRHAYRQKNAANRDAYTSAHTVYLDELPTEPTDGAVSPESTPAYLNTPEYKAALEALRKRIPDGKRKPKRTPWGLAKAQAAVAEYVAANDPVVPTDEK